MAPRNNAWRTPFVTERPETVAVGSKVPAGTDPEKIVESTRAMVERASERMSG